MNTHAFDIRRAGPADAAAIAEAHLDSIRSIGSRYYDADTAREWAARVEPGRYVNAMARGEVFFVAVARAGEPRQMLGFSSHTRIGTEHRTGVYVRGSAARQGVGTALFRAAEADAIAAGAHSLHVDASLAAIDFYRANGFEEVGRGEHALPSGATMACVFMRKVF